MDSQDYLMMPITKPRRHQTADDELLSCSPDWSKDPFAIDIDSRGLKSVTNTLQPKPYVDHRLSIDSTRSKRTSTDSTMSSIEYYAKGRPAPIYQTTSNQEEYWAFLKSVPDIQNGNLIPPSRCPSLISGGTLSSRNSSTRSTRSSMQDSMDDRNSTRRSVCIIPEEYGDIAFKTFQEIDLSSHLAASIEPVAEVCPVKTCERHLNGFSKAGEGKRHAFKHFKGSLVCGFCKPYITTFFRAPDRVNLFLTHLVKNHGVRGHHNDHEVGGARLVRKKSTGPVSNCSICSEPFTAQVLYEHLPGCILREVARSDESRDRESQEESSQEPSRGDKLSRSPHVKYRSSRANANKPQIMIPGPEREPSPGLDLEEECQEIVELTASSRCLSLTSSKAVESSEEETDDSEEVTSRESSPGVSQLPRRLSPAKRRAVDAIMQEFQRLFNQSMRSHTNGESSSGSSYNGSGAWSSNASTYSSASFVSRKRSLSGGGATPPNDEDDSNKRRRVPGSKTAGKQAVLEQRFACPYYKRNPGRHTTFTSCRDPGFTTVARLKEHLYRRHVLPPQCHRCCTTFSNDILLREHQRDPRGCPIQERIPLEGFDKDQERLLKSKKRSLKLHSEEDKWKGVYRILFPDDGDDDMPSPYIEYQVCVGSSAEPSNITRFQEFSRLELPRLVRRTLESVVEQEAQPLEDKLKEQLVDIVAQCQTQLVSMFQAAIGSATAEEQPPSLPLIETQPAFPTTQLPGDSASMLPFFEGFDSLSEGPPIASTSAPIPTPSHPLPPTTTTTALTLPHHRKTSSQTTDSGLANSPDSGYDSTWASASTCASSTHLSDRQFPIAGPVTGLCDTNAAHMPHSLSGPEYLDLGGYYGLFESRGTDMVEQGMPGMSGMAGLQSVEVPSMDGWAFMQELGDVGEGMQGGGVVGDGQLSGLNAGWTV